MGKMKHSAITQSNKFAISLQYLQKEVRNGGHFWHADKCKSFYKLILSFLMEVARHVQNTQNRKLVIFLQYIKKNCRNCFVFYCDAKHSEILRRLLIIPWETWSVNYKWHYDVIAIFARADTSDFQLGNAKIKMFVRKFC